MRSRFFVAWLTLGLLVCCLIVLAFIGLLSIIGGCR